MTLVPDFERAVTLPVAEDGATRAVAGVGGSQTFWSVKSMLDVAGALVLLPFVALLACVLIVLNPVFNPGPLFYRQERMGHRFVPFTAYKFRTMRGGAAERGHNDPVEAERITPLGRVLRRMGLDELPQALNILRGEMSLIGPRPDCLHHAEAFLTEISDYPNRYSVRPGLSGLAQISLGYTVGTEATRAKVQADLHYIGHASFALDAWIVWRTIITMLAGRGD